MDSGTIYMYTSPSGKKYIGQTWAEEKRKRQHELRTNIKTPFSEAIKKYGYGNMTYEILHKGIRTQDELDFLERSEIERHNTVSPDGYNLMTGRAHGRHSEETKRKISEAGIGRKMTESHKKTLLLFWSGHHHSEETKMKISKAKTGMKMSAEAIEKNRVAHLGLKRTPEQIEKTRQVWIGRKHRPESIKKMSDSKKGKKLSPQAVENIRQACIGRKHSEETKRKISEANKGKPKTKDHIEKMKATKKIKRDSKNAI